MGRAIGVCPALVLLIGSVRGGDAGLEGINLAGSVGVAFGTAPRSMALTRCKPMEQAGSIGLFAASLKGGFLKFSAEMEDFLAKKQANHKALCDGLIVKGCLFFFFFRPLRLYKKIFYWHPLVFYSNRDHLKNDPLRFQLHFRCSLPGRIM